MTHVTVHVAGPVKNGMQSCSRCGEALIDYRGTNVMVAGESARLMFWPDGGFIGRVGAGWVLMEKDATCVDEIACRSSIQ